jgi:hypothetical protein
MKNLLILLIFPCLSFGQNTFSKRMHFNYSSAALGSVLVTDSCYFVSGIVRDSIHPFFIGNIFAKLNLSGDVEFTKSLFSSEAYIETLFGDLITTSDGNILDFGRTTSSTTQGVLIKFNTNGDSIATKLYTSPYYPNDPFIVPIQALELPNEDIIVLDAIAKNNGNNDVCISKFDNQLNLLSQKVFGNQYDELPGYSLLFDNENLIIGANRDNTNLTSQNFWSKSWIFEVDGQGNIAWEYFSPSGILQDGAKDMVLASDGGLVVGTSRGFEQPINAEDAQIRWESAYFFKLNTNHEVEWDLEVFDSINSSVGNEIAKLISVDGGSAYVAAGRFNLTRSLNPPIGGTFGWFFKFSDEGELIWLRKYQYVDTVGHSHRIYDLKPTPDGGMIAVGEARNPFISPEPSQQAWLLKLDSFGCLIPGCQWQDTVTVSGQPGKAAAELAIYPNPTSDYLNFQLRSPQAIPQAAFRILDAAGRVVKEFQSEHPGDTVIVPVWDWAPGVYFLEASTQGRILKTEKFVVLR